MVSFKEINDNHNSRYVIDAADKYEVHIKNSPHYVIRVPIEYFNKAAKFTHPNIVARKVDVFEYKHCRKNGSKFWTSALGLELYIVIPADKISLDTTHKGYSYPKVNINGQEFVATVSAGTSGNGWADWIEADFSLCGTKKWTIAKLNCLADAALSPSECALRGITLDIKDYDEHDLKGIAREYYKKTFNLEQGMRFFYDSDKIGVIKWKQRQGYVFKDMDNNVFKISAKRINFFKTAQLYVPVLFAPKIENLLKKEESNVVNVA